MEVDASGRSPGLRIDADHGRLPGRALSRWHDGRRLPAHSCATAPDFHRLPVTRSVIQLWPSSMRRVRDGFVKGVVGTLEAMLQAGPQAVAVISVHASPLSDLGSGENGGMNLAIRRLCEGLSLRGVPTDVFVRRDGPGPDEELIAPLSRLVRLPVGPPTRDPQGGGPRAARRVHATRPSVTRSRSVAHIVPSMATTGMAASSAASFARRGASRGCSRSTRWRSPRLAPVCRSTRSAPRPRSSSPLRPTGSSPRASSEAKDLIRLYHASRDRICVAQPGVDPRLFAAHDGPGLRRRLGIDASARVALFAGRLEPLKGAQILLDAAAWLRARRRASPTSPWSSPATTAVTARSDDRGGERRRLERHAARIGLADHVRFVGAVPHEQLADYYAMADVCVVPSLTESFGLVALEAQALGTPVVAAAVGGLREIVEDGVTGYLVEGHEPRGLRARHRCRPGGPGSQSRDGRGGSASRRTLHVAPRRRPPGGDLRPAQRRGTAVGEPVRLRRRRSRRADDGRRGLASGYRAGQPAGRGSDPKSPTGPSAPACRD